MILSFNQDFKHHNNLTLNTHRHLLTGNHIQNFIPRTFAISERPSYKNIKTKVEISLKTFPIDVSIENEQVHRKSYILIQ
jgi:hypothetical protein